MQQSNQKWAIHLLGKRENSSRYKTEQSQPGTVHTEQLDQPDLKQIILVSDGRIRNSGYP